MKKTVWAWVIGSFLFALVAAMWVWQLPKTLSAASGSHDVSLGSIFSSFGEAKQTLAPEFANIQAQLDKNMNKINAAVGAQAAQASALDKLKQDLTDEAAKQKIKAVLNQEPTTPLRSGSPSEASGLRAGQANNQ